MWLARRSPRTAAVCVAALAHIVCVSACNSPNGERASVPVIEPVELTVDNKNTLDITIYVSHDGRTDRLDRVESLRKKALVIPTRMIGVAGDVRLVGQQESARAGFGRRIASQSVNPQHCQRLEWTIEPRIELSSLGVFPRENC